MTIQSTHVITLNTDGSARDVTINGTLTVSANKILNIFGNFINNNIFNCSTSSVEMKGLITEAQNIGGSAITTFNKLIISNNIMNGIRVSNNLNINKTLTINKDCTLHPDATAVISGGIYSNLENYGTVKVTRIIIGSEDYFSQYPGYFGRLIGSVEYNGESNQVINPVTYINLTINNASKCNLRGQADCKTLIISKGVSIIENSGSLNVETNASISDSLVVNSGGEFYVTGDIAINGGKLLVLKSSSISSSSFTYGTYSGAGTINVIRFMSATDNWHLYSSPVSGQSVHSFLQTNPEIPDLLNASKQVIGVGMRDYNTAVDQWNAPFIYGNTDTGDMTPGKGYSVRTLQTDAIHPGMIYSTGTPVNHPTSTLNTTGNKWNCIGNPYTCVLDATVFLSLNSTLIDNIYPGVYIWDSSTSGYKPHIAAENYPIQFGQGFFVKSKSAGGSIIFEPTMQSPDPIIPFKAAKIQWPSIEIVSANQSSLSSTKFMFITNTTKGLDIGYDAGMLKANPDFALYSRLLEDNGVDFSLQCLPDQNYDQYAIPLGIDCKAGGDVTFTAETVNLPSGCQALLEDRAAKRFTRLDLKDAKYTATVSADTKGTGRFFLHTSDVISGDQPIEKEQFKVNKIGKTLYINGEVSDNANFFVYSVTGQQLANFKAQNQVQNQFDASGLPAGVYILTVNDKSQKKSIKFVIEN
ncbi:MAG: T9SS type A sorting domain-containing protein [Mariniphaga sp.]|nr:T9SS type A sorting domain-containing protein [Mariniphaga sp.]